MEDGWLRVTSGTARLGSWKLDQITLERLSLYRFELTTRKRDRIIVYPDDPTGFAEATGATIDLTAVSRFGLGQRLAEPTLEEADLSP